MIETLKESRGRAIGFQVIGQLTAPDIDAIAGQLDAAIVEQKQPIGLVLDLTGMQGATWAARWEETRFLQRHADHIARMAVVSNDKWEEVAEMAAVATASLQAATLYFLPAEMAQAWQWARMSLDQPPTQRVLYPGKGLFKNYTPEFNV